MSTVLHARVDDQVIGYVRAVAAASGLTEAKAAGALLLICQQRGITRVRVTETITAEPAG